MMGFDINSPCINCEHERLSPDQEPCVSCIRLNRERPTDLVNHPSDYNSHPSGIECLDIAKHHNFCIGNAIKYLWRAGLKGGKSKEIEDLHKAIFYIQQQIKDIEAELTR